MNDLKLFLKNLKIHHYIVIVLIISIGVFNAITALSPIIKQSKREKNIVKIFNEWWESEGAAQFIAVGLKADDKIKSEEFEQFRERYLKQNHTFIIEDRMLEMKKEFRNWWEIDGGKEQYIQEHKIYPSEIHYNIEYEKWIKKYTDKHVRYAFAYVPKYGEYERLITSFLLFPNIWSYLIFAIFFFFSYNELSKRWGIPITIGTFIAFIFIGGFFVDILASTSFFKYYASDRYMGGSIPLAFLLGACLFSSNKKVISDKVKIIAIVGVIIDSILNIFINKGIFGSVMVSSLFAFGLGVLGGIKIPTRKKTIGEIKAEALEERIRKSQSINLQTERKKKTRMQINEGLQEAAKAHFPLAKQLLSQAMIALLQEFPIDVQTTKNLAKSMTSENMFIDVSSEEWLEWGETAKSKNCYETALILLEKGLSFEKEVSLARRALYSIGEIRINKNLDKENGILRLKKVIELGDKDILAIQAKKLIENCE